MVLSTIYAVSISDKVKFTEAATGGVLYKTLFLKFFAIFTGKHLRWSVFVNTVAGPKPCNFIKKRLQHRCFPVNIAKMFKNNFLYRTPPVAASVKMFLNF